ncbi:MAG: hypothetical protein H6739_09865 [Alphaproteobacteria bacterium]|nr:hypothetical protein [Alphaproteobacteria bacterium]
MNLHILGVSTHYGRAELVTVGVRARRPALIDRRQVPLIAADLPGAPYHHEALEMERAAAEALVHRVRASVSEHALTALREAHARGALAAVVIEESPYAALPASLSEVLDSWALTCAADGMMVREAVADSAAALGLRVERHPRKADLVALAATALGTTPGRVTDLLRAFGRQAGPPWRKEHQRAAAAALLVLGRLQPEGLALD